MRLHVSLTLDFSGDAAELRERLLAWGHRGGFRLAEESEDRWLLRRGHKWGNLLVFTDIHGLYCEVEARHLPRTRQISVGMECSSWFHIQTPGDRKKLQDELERIRAFFVGDLGEQRERWHRERGGRDDRIEG